MNFLTSSTSLDPAFPFHLTCGNGFTMEHYENDTSYMHRHHCLELNLCLNGQGRYYIGEQEYPIETGDLFIINDLEYHQAINLSGNMKLLVLVFTPDMILKESADYNLIRTFYEWKRGFQHRITAAEEAAALMLEMEREYREKKIGYQTILKATLLKLLALLYRSFAETESSAAQVRRFQTAYNTLAPAIFYIEQHLREPITLAQLAEAVSLNANYFSGLFSSLMGIRVSEYILQKRLKYAAGLLVSTDQSVLSVAMESGFGNISYFNRVFRKQFALTPGQYRKQIRGL